MSGREWQRYLAPAAFLLAATVAILLVRSGLEAGDSTVNTVNAPVSTPTVPPRHTVSTTAKTTTARAKTKTTPAGQRFWTVQAGDTFSVISSKTGVPAATIERLNPNVRSTSLFIGEKLRLR
jgi:LysM repeat protein